MSRAGIGAWPVVLGFAAAIWLLGQIMGQFATPTAERAVDALPRSGQGSGGVGRVGQLSVDSVRRGQATLGTAWHVGEDAWLSNRHVLERCALHELQTSAPAEVERLWAHPDADLAAARAATDTRPVPLATTAPARGTRAFALGYPQGEAGVAELTLRAEGRLELTGALSSAQPFRYKVWAVRALPDHVRAVDGLGGISGGTIIDQDGDAIGTVFGGNRRRGTVYSIPYAEVRAAADALAAERPTGGRASIADPRRHAERLLASDRVARVVCHY